jgi:hypothetical protein
MRLTLADSIESGDWVVIWKSADGDFRGVTLTDFIDAIVASGVTGRMEEYTQRAAPGATGFSVSILGSDPADDVHLILTPVAGYAAGTLVLPPASTCRDKQTVLVNTTQAVTTLTITPNGASAVVGVPTTLTANAYFRLKYDKATNNWYRID